MAVVKRGELHTGVLPKEVGKPRPVLVVQSDLFLEEHATITVAPLTSHLVDAPYFRYTLQPEDAGLEKVSQVMIDKLMTVDRDKIGPKIGEVPEHHLQEINRLMVLFLGIT